MKNFFRFLLMVLLISACATAPETAEAPASIPPTETPLPTVTPACVSSEPTEEDVDRAISFAEDVLEPDEWDQSSQVLDGSVAVTWQNILENAVVYVEALIFPCGYEEQDLDRYFGDANWDAIFANYEEYELLGECNTGDGLRLYQFEAAGFGFDYDVHYWVLNDTGTRVITVLMSVPFGSEFLLDDYSSRLFPELTACL